MRDEPLQLRPRYQRPLCIDLFLASIESIAYMNATRLAARLS